METLFRLMLIRPAVEQDPSFPSIRLRTDSAFQLALRSSDTTDRQAIETHARLFVQGAEFIGTTGDSPLESQLDSLGITLDTLEAKSELDAEDIANAVQVAFATPALTIVQDAAFQDAKRRLADSLVAIKILRSEHRRPLESLARQLRDMELINRFVENPGIIRTGFDLIRFRKLSFQLPDLIKLPSQISSEQLSKDLAERLEATIRERHEQVQALLHRHQSLANAIRELGDVGPNQFRASPQVRSEGLRSTEELQLDVQLNNLVGYKSQLRSLQVKALELDVERRRDSDAAIRPREWSARTPLEQELHEIVRPLSGSPSFRPRELADIGFVLTENAANGLSRETRETAAAHGLQLNQVALDRVVNQLSQSLEQVFHELQQLSGTPTKSSYRRIGKALIVTETPVIRGWNAVSIGGHIPLDQFQFDFRVPTTKGNVQPAGVADLLVVRQQLVGYESADVAHIENVLKGERKARTYTRRESSTLLVADEVEQNLTESQELETTDRFEMARESAETIKEDTELQAGLKVSGKYGPAVTFSASAEAAFKRSKEESTKVASKFSQEVTEKSSRKISEKVLTRRSITTTTETIEVNEHSLDNTNGTGHISGVYQWVNKIYQAQMFNYGVRMMFDFMVPEPAAFLIQSMKSGHANAIQLTKPPEFNLRPEDISESNYGYFVKIYGATDVLPAPPPFKTFSADWTAGGAPTDKESGVDFNQSGQLVIEEGYVVMFGAVTAIWNQQSENANIDIALGRRSNRLSGDQRVWTTELDLESGSIAYGINTLRISDVAIVIEVIGRRDNRALRLWQLDTHSKLLTAHRAMVADYEEKIARLELEAGVEIEGMNPMLNRVIIENELKKNCISILTDQHFDLFNSIETSPVHGLEQTKIHEAEAEGAFVRFFEQAFEWENIAWATYPYFWGRKSEWSERIAYEDPDPIFNEFLKAGFCRVVVPARPGFEDAIDHFLTFGELWDGGPLPSISSDHYLPIADEIAERLGLPGDERPQGDPWTVRVPTSLVKIRPDDSLPRWTQDSEGNWIES